MGGFLEAILAVMVVITAASVFLVVIRVGGIGHDGLDEGQVIDLLVRNGLWPDGEPLEMGSLPGFHEDLHEPEGLEGLRLSYRPMGHGDPLLTLGDEPPPGAEVLSISSPALLRWEGATIAGMAEVRAW